MRGIFVQLFTDGAYYFLTNIYLNLTQFLNDNKHLPIEINDRILHYYIYDKFNIKKSLYMKNYLDINDDDLTEDIQKIVKINYKNNKKLTQQILNRFNEYKIIYNKKINC
jgi:hypothetical protein